jgi:hypothetical protein
MNLLEKVAALVRVRLIRIHESFQSTTVSCRGFLVEIVLPH